MNTGFADRQDTKALLETYLFLKDKLKLIFEKEKAVLIHCDQGRNRCRKSFLFFLMVFRSVVYVIKSLFFSNVFQICGNLSYVCIGVYELVFVRCIPSPEGNSVFTTYLRMFAQMRHFSGRVMKKRYNLEEHLTTQFLGGQDPGTREGI